MNTDTGQIKRFTPEEIKKLNEDAGKKLWIEIPRDEMPQVQAMNRKQRRAWSAEKRKGSKNGV
jgi:hypothetical protein